jgi:hypothetical protein
MVMGGFGRHRWTNGHRALDFCILQFLIESLQNFDSYRNGHSTAP